MSMRPRPRAVALAAVLLVLAAGLAWLWFALMVKRMEAQHYQSEAAARNPLLAATRLLVQQGHPVRAEMVLDHRLLASLPNGTLLLETRDAVSAEQAGTLLDWVRRGNTLIMSPQWVRSSNDEDEAADNSPSESEVIERRFGVSMSARAAHDTDCDAAAPAAAKAHAPAAQDGDQEDDEDGNENDADHHLACVTPPAHGHALQLQRFGTVLQSEDGAPDPLWGDTNGLAVQVYREGKGHVVMVGGRYFDNFHLRSYDHGELLVTLAALSGPNAPVLVVEKIESIGWSKFLWVRGAPALTGLALMLALWLWGASRRFGPMLPAPDGARRSLMEHIDASGRWLWKLPGGRELLLAAVRHGTETLLLRRAPELHALSAAQRVAHLARRCNLPEADVHHAMHQPASHLPTGFTRQISTLQQLRAHHER
jgi:hypothetical protein